jgi:RimJ/RimL family protein N-acetyltransferase
MQAERPSAGGTEHPLAAILADAARGSFPAPDGTVDVVPRPPGRTQAVVGFTAHYVIAADVPPEEARARLDPNDLGAPMTAPFLSWLGELIGARPGMLDLVMITFGGQEDRSPIQLIPRDDLREHPRVARSMRYREDLRVYSDPEDASVLMLGRGLAGRWEVSIEVDPAHRERGLGRTLAAAARRLVPQDEPLFAQVTPANVASLRAFLAAGYRPIGSEVLFL